MLAAAAAILAVIFAALAWLVISGETEALDKKFVASLRIPSDLLMPAGPAWGLEFIRGMTELAGWPFITLLMIFLTIYLCMKRRYLDSALLLAVIIGKSLNVSWFKAMFGRERPDIPHLVEATSMSFPSGHSASASSLYLMLAFIMTRNIESAAERTFIFASAGVLIFLIGFSRIYLGVHYPTDVLAGWALGAVWAMILLLIAEYWRLRQR